MKRNLNEKIRLISSIVICTLFITTTFSGIATAIFDQAVETTNINNINNSLYSKTACTESNILIEPLWQNRYNLVALLMSDDTGGYDFDESQGFLPFKAHTAIGPQDAIVAEQASYFLPSSITAAGTAELRTETLPPVEWATADSGSMFHADFTITEPVKFTIIGQISAQASSPMGLIVSRTAVRVGYFDDSNNYILDHYIEMYDGEKIIPFSIKGTLKPGNYYMAAWASGYFDLPGKSFSHDTEAKSGYYIDLDVTPIKQL